MKIMFVVKNFPPLIGGDGTYIQNISKRLIKKDIVIVCCSDKNKLKINGRTKVYGAGLVGISSLNSSLLLKIPSYIRLIFKIFKVFLKEKPNVIHTNSLDLSIIGSMLSTIRRTKHITTIHGLWGHCPVSYGSRIGKVLKKTMEKIALKLGRIDTVIGVDQFSATTAKKICSKKVVYIPNGIDLDNIAKNIASAPKETKYST